MRGVKADNLCMVAQDRQTLPCALCGVTVIRRPSEMMRRSSRGNVFCCREHFWEFNKGTKRTRKKNHMLCDACGVSFPRHPSAVRGEHVYCSVSCAATPRGGFSVLPMGTTRITGDGYIHIKTDGGWRGEHRVVMEQALERPLRAFENVHHLNGDRADNRLENLELWVKSQPSGQRPADLVAWAREILNLYAAEVSA